MEPTLFLVRNDIGGTVEITRSISDSPYPNICRHIATAKETADVRNNDDSSQQLQSAATEPVDERKFPKRLYHEMSICHEAYQTS